MQDATNIPEAETVWLKAIAAEQSDRLAEELIQPNSDSASDKSVEESAANEAANAAEVAEKSESGDAVKCPPMKDGMEYGSTDAVMVPPSAGMPVMPQQEMESEPALSFGEQMLVDRMDDLIAIMSDIRDRLSTTGSGDAVSSPQAVVPAEDAGSNLSSALLAALTITDGILATRK